METLSSFNFSSWRHLCWILGRRLGRCTCQTFEHIPSSLSLSNFKCDIELWAVSDLPNTVSYAWPANEQNRVRSWTLVFFLLLLGVCGFLGCGSLLWWCFWLRRYFLRVLSYLLLTRHLCVWMQKRKQTNKKNIFHVSQLHYSVDWDPVHSIMFHWGTWLMAAALWHVLWVALFLGLPWSLTVYKHCKRSKTEGWKAWERGYSTSLSSIFLLGIG